MRKIETETLSLRKNYIYDVYEKLVNDPKSYDSISRRQMQKEVLEEFLERYKHLEVWFSPFELQSIKKDRELFVDQNSISYASNSIKMILSNTRIDLLHESGLIAKSFYTYKGEYFDALNNCTPLSDSVYKQYTEMAYFFKAILLYKATCKEYELKEAYMKYIQISDAEYNFYRNLQEPLEYDYKSDVYQEELSFMGWGFDLDVDYNSEFDLNNYSFEELVEVGRTGIPVEVKSYIKELNITEYNYYDLVDAIQEYNYNRCIQILMNMMDREKLIKATEKEADKIMANFNSIIELWPKWLEEPSSNPLVLTKNQSDNYFMFIEELTSYLNNKLLLYPIPKESVKYTKTLTPLQQYELITKVFENNELLDDFRTSNSYTHTDNSEQFITGFETAIEIKRGLIFILDDHTSNVYFNNGIYRIKGLSKPVIDMLNNNPVFADIFLIPFEDYFIYPLSFQSMNMGLGDGIISMLQKEINESEYVIPNNY